MKNKIVYEMRWNHGTDIGLWVTMNKIMNDVIYLQKYNKLMTTFSDTIAVQIKSNKKVTERMMLR